MTSIKQYMIQFALMLGLFSLGSIDVSRAQFLDAFRARNTITADAITRTPVGTRVVLTGSIKSNVRRAQYVFRIALDQREFGSKEKSGAEEK